MQRLRLRPSRDGERADGVRLAQPVQDVADEPAGEHPVHRLRDGAHRTGQTKPLGDDLGQLVRGRRHQPHLLAGVEMHLGQRPGARPDPVGDDLVVDLLAQRAQFGGRSTLDEGQRLAAALGDVVAVLPAGQLELGLGVDELPHVAVTEVLAGGQTTAEVHQRGSLHQRVVDIEEGRGGQVDRRRRRRGRFGGVLPGLPVCAFAGVAGDRPSQQAIDRTLRAGLSGFALRQFMVGTHSSHPIEGCDTDR